MSTPWILAEPSAEAQADRACGFGPDGKPPLRDAGGASRPLYVTRDDAADWLQAAAWALRGDRCGAERPYGCALYPSLTRLYVPTQAHTFAHVADEVLSRGPVWMRRQARVFAMRARYWLRPPVDCGLNQRHMLTIAHNVRAYFFAAAVLRACAATLEAA